MKFALITAILLSSIGLAQAASAEKGQALVEKANCASCHGAGLNAQFCRLTQSWLVSILIIFITP